MKRFASFIIVVLFASVVSTCIAGLDDSESLRFNADGKHKNLDSQQKRIVQLRKEIEEFYSLSPCSKEYEYCSMPILVERVNRLTDALCAQGRLEEAIEYYQKFSHFQDPHPKDPECKV